MNFIQLFIYLIQLIDEIRPWKMTFIYMKPFMYGHIHACRWIKITLNLKLQAQSSKFKFYVDAQAIFNW